MPYINAGKKKKTRGKVGGTRRQYRKARLKGKRLERGMMSYFVSRGELLYEIEKAVDAIFKAVATCLSDEEKKFNTKLGVLREEFLLLIDAMGGSESHQLRKNKLRRNQMSERKFEEILKELIDHILKGNDEEAIILADELEKSAEGFKKEQVRIKEKLGKIQKKTEEFLKQEGIEKEEKKQD